MLSLIIRNEFDNYLDTTFVKEDHKQFFKNHVAKDRIVNKIISEIQMANLQGFLLSDIEIREMTKQLASMYCNGLITQLEIKEGLRKRVNHYGEDDAS